MIKADPVTTRTLSISLGGDGLVHVKVLKDAEMKLADAREGDAIIRELSAGRRLPRLCDYTEIRSQDAECRAYYASKETSEGCLACAIVIASPVSRIIGNFYMGLNRPVTPTKLFTSPEKAARWLRGFQ